MTYRSQIRKFLDSTINSRRLYPKTAAVSVAVSLLLILTARPAVSHPHVFITTRLTAVFDKNGLSGIRVRWDFDEFFSAMISEDYDDNKNGRLDPSEIKNVRQDAFSNLANFEYFTFIKIDGNPFKVKYIKEFTATIDSSGRLSYSFLIPCHVKAAATQKKFTIAQYDPSYYAYVAYSENTPIEMENTENITFSYTIEENENETYYFGMLHPVEVVVTFKLK